jgi:hypothetical protein
MYFEKELYKRHHKIQGRESRDFYGYAYRLYGGLKPRFTCVFQVVLYYIPVTYIRDLLQPTWNKELLPPIPYFPSLCS